MEMATFNAYLKKEIMESSRQYRYLVFAIGILVFSIMDPLMLKLLPTMLKNQLPVDLASLMVTTPKAAVAKYISDLFQLGNIFVVFIIGGILTEEIRSQKLVFPYSMGTSPAGVVLAKVFHYTITVTVLVFLGLFISFYYSGMLFSGECADFTGVMVSAMLMSLFFFFSITLSMLLSSLVKRGITAGFISLAVSFVTSSITGIESIGKFMPYKLVQGAGMFSMEGMAFTVIFVLVLCAVFIILTIRRMEKVEVI